MKQDLIEVKDLIAKYSIAEHCRLAENYFASADYWTYYLGKPFTHCEQTPQLLINFATLLQGLDLLPGIKVLDFGAGTCWTSRCLTQLNCKVFALDVSATALTIGRELYARNPPFGKRSEPHFLLFDGIHIPLPDKSVERIVCFDAFHHVPNPERILAELSRVLTEGGIAGFSEPGPEHSKTLSSQHEMRAYDVIENDVVIEQVWQAAQRVGFTAIKLAVSHTPPFQLSLEEFNDLLVGGTALQTYAEAVRQHMQAQRNFFLYKGDCKINDSRNAVGLTAQIELADAELTVRAGENIGLTVTVTNLSLAVWLPLSEGAGTVGGVELGVHLYAQDGRLIEHRFHSEPVSAGAGRSIMPHEQIRVVANIPPLTAGTYILELDMVSNDVCWFAQNGSATPRLKVRVI